MNGPIMRCATAGCFNVASSGNTHCFTHINEEFNVEEEVSNNPNVNPSHYKDYPTGQECIDIIEHLKSNPSAACKYIFRCGQKGTPIQDYEKAIRYLEFEIRKIKRECEVLGVPPEEVNYQSWIPALSSEDIKKKED